ncbi:uncharacterized protein JCM6883_001455 [Sporobolomyces salmoneus]|uniref:uncharacterized protein n=1 Tax=Sporobolomyces salmoneus TaxID=183962 RepID=UPI003179A30C
MSVDTTYDIIFQTKFYLHTRQEVVFDGWNDELSLDNDIFFDLAEKNGLLVIQRSTIPRRLHLLFKESAGALRAAQRFKEYDLSQIGSEGTLRASAGAGADSWDSDQGFFATTWPERVWYESTLDFSCTQTFAPTPFLNDTQHKIHWKLWHRKQAQGAASTPGSNDLATIQDSAPSQMVPSGPQSSANRQEVPSNKSQSQPASPVIGNEARISVAEENHQALHSSSKTHRGRSPSLPPPPPPLDSHRESAASRRSNPRSPVFEKRPSLPTQQRRRSSPPPSRRTYTSSTTRPRTPSPPSRMENRRASSASLRFLDGPEYDTRRPRSRSPTPPRRSRSPSSRRSSLHDGASPVLNSSSRRDSTSTRSSSRRDLPHHDSSSRQRHSSDSSSALRHSTSAPTIREESEYQRNSKPSNPIASSSGQSGTRSDQGGAVNNILSARLGIFRDRRHHERVGDKPFYDFDGLDPTLDWGSDKVLREQVDKMFKVTELTYAVLSLLPVKQAQEADDPFNLSGIRYLSSGKKARTAEANLS